MNTVIDNWIDHQLFLTGEYKNTYGTHGCDKSQPPPSAENKICKKFHEQIKQLKDKKNKDDINEDFVKAFLETPIVAESLLIPTNEIRFHRFLDTLVSLETILDIKWLSHWSFLEIKDFKSITDYYRV